MAQGRGNASAAAMLLIIVCLQSCSLWHQASAATYTVGGSQGWTLSVDYTTWAAGKTFKAGDILFFPYTQGEHNVVVVDKAGYDACSAANASTTDSAGNTNVTLTGTGAHYYLCSVIGHCSAGMKLAVTVTATSAAPASPPATKAAPTTTPASAPSKTPSSSPSKTPSSSPITTPSTAPSPTSPPSSAPVPAPSAESPASAPVPAPSAETPTSSAPSAPGSTPSSAATPPSPPPPPNAAPSLLVSATFAPLLALLAALFAL